MERREQRDICPVCGRSVAVADDEALVFHLRPHVPGTPFTPRCSGGALPPTDGLIRLAANQIESPVTLPADSTVSSVRALRGGLPGQGRRR
jgi:hypothetical protein